MKEFQCQLGVGVLVAAVMLLAAWAGTTALLGAHPFWDVQVVWIGVAASFVGRPLVWPLRTKNALISMLLAAALLIAIVLTVWGKDGFVSSYAEDYLAGRFWYLGWTAISGLFHALIWQNIARIYCSRAA